MNGPDLLEITILLQGNFTFVFSFRGAAPETPAGGPLAPGPPSRGDGLHPNPRRGYNSPRTPLHGGVHNLPRVYIRLKQRPLNNHAPHPTVLQKSWYLVRKEVFISSQELIVHPPRPMNHHKAAPFKVEGNSFSF